MTDQDLLELTVSLRDFYDTVWSMHRSEHEQGEKAIEVALRELGRRLEIMNEFRAQLSTERQSYVTREVFDTRNDETNRRVMIIERQASNLEGRLWSLGIGLTIILIVIEVALRFIKI